MDFWYDGSHAITFYQYENSINNPLGSIIGRTWKDWGLIPTSRPLVAPPPLKSSSLDIQGADSILDMSEALTGWPLYGNRTGSWTFYVTDYNNHEDIILDSAAFIVIDEPLISNLNNNPSSWIRDNDYDPIRATTIENWSFMYTKLLNALHGKYLAVVLDDDPNYFYKGRFKISQWISSNDGSLSGVTIDYDLFPYKFAINNTIIHLEGNSFAILGGRKPVIPDLFTVKANDQTGLIGLEFTNPELDLHYTNIEWGNDTRQYDALENIGAQGNSVDFIISNLSGSNICTLRVTNANICQNISLRYRVGDL